MHTNKEGHVSYITVVGVYGLVMNGTITNLFSTIGLTMEEMKELVGLMKNNDISMTWCNAANRNIMVKIGDAQGVQSKEITTIAVKQK